MPVFKSVLFFFILTNVIFLCFPKSARRAAFSLNTFEFSVQC